MSSILQSSPQSGTRPPAAPEPLARTKPRAGVYGMPFDRVGGGQLHQLIVADVLSSSYDVDLIHHVPGLDQEQLARHYELDVRGLNLRYVKPFAGVWPYGPEGRRFEGKPFDSHRALTEPYDLFVSVVVGPPIRSYARRSVLLVLFPFAGRPQLWPWSEPADRTPAPKRIIRNAYYWLRWRRIFASYTQCVANSAFTASWVRERWGRDAEVIFPPVRARFAVQPKEKLILSVGRFSRRGTQKRQLEMVQAFVRAYDKHLNGWEFWCAGGVSNGPADRRYFDEVAEAAKGHPVRLIPNAPGDVVRDAYERAAVFWHAAGYRVEEHLQPEQTEHFGMSTVEAMAAGCVPVVIRKGGQREIVEHGKSGFLFDTLDELVQHSTELALSPGLREEMADAARQRARVFTDVDAFADRMRAVVHP